MKHDIPPPKIKYGTDYKYDLKLSAALVHERRLADILRGAKIETLELKTENRQWELTGNIAIEITHAGRACGFLTSEADWWVHQLRREERTLVYLWFAHEDLLELCVESVRAGRIRRNVGSDGRFTVVLIRLIDLLTMN